MSIEDILGDRLQGFAVVILESIHKRDCHVGASTEQAHKNKIQNMVLARSRAGPQARGRPKQQIE